MDSGIEVNLVGFEPCRNCQAHLDPLSARLYDIVNTRRLFEKANDDLMLNMARVLVSTSSQRPIQGKALASLLDTSEREIKETAARLCDEWSLPTIATRKPPYGYFIAASAEELLEWGRVTRSQAIKMLARFYHLFKTNYPALAGQQSLDFINTVSTELQEAIR